MHDFYATRLVMLRNGEINTVELDALLNSQAIL
jgi:hypothetical protein